MIPERQVKGSDYPRIARGVANAPERPQARGRADRAGARRDALRASRDAGVTRVVLTSSFAAIGHGQKPRETHSSRSQHALGTIKPEMFESVAVDRARPGDQPIELGLDGGVEGVEVQAQDAPAIRLEGRLAARGEELEERERWRLLHHRAVVYFGSCSEVLVAERLGTV